MPGRGRIRSWRGSAAAAETGARRRAARPSPWPRPSAREAPPRRRERGAPCRPARPRMRRGARGTFLPAAISLSPACSAWCSAPPAAPAFPPASPPLRHRRHSAEKVRAGRWEEGGLAAGGCGSAGGGGWRQERWWRAGPEPGLSRASAPLPWSRAPSGPVPGWGCSAGDRSGMRVRCGSAWPPFLLPGQPLPDPPSTGALIASADERNDNEPGEARQAAGPSAHRGQGRHRIPSVSLRAHRAEHQRPRRPERGAAPRCGSWAAAGTSRVSPVEAMCSSSTSSLFCSDLWLHITVVSQPVFLYELSYKARRIWRE